MRNFNCVNMKRKELIFRIIVKSYLTMLWFDYYRITTLSWLDFCFFCEIIYNKLFCFINEMT